MTNQGHHYRECGLDYVYLLNGFTFKQTKYGETISIHDIDGLHRVIGLYLVREKKRLTGADVRFLRHELDLSQRMLGELLDKSSQTVARWEKDQVRIDGPADRLLRLLYEKHAGGRSRIRTLLQRLAELDSGREEQIQFEDTEKGWQLHIAA